MPAPAKVAPAQCTKCQCPVTSLFNKAHLKSYACTFGAGYISGICGELFTLAQGKKLTAANITAPQFRDLCAISGVQQVAKELSKNTILLVPGAAAWAKKHPFLFGASTGVPMWALTRLFGTPLQNSRKKGVKPFQGYKDSFLDQAVYHTVKNGLDQVSADVINPMIVPKVNGFWPKRAVEGVVSGIVGAGCYVLTWPYKLWLSKQTLPQAVALCNKNFSKVFIKKVSYTVVRPPLVKALN
ncbi:hypothetical protein TVAG_440200 [Trichomonas vaginalis G3]|uniref:Uncharacterized protein n=1 Tax=Trichomonas vaginalis (strain ATCC PRA-98 / G3) TaxID=412133 RepID=A2FDM3_TRIV3|nr:hypothetical protein TVAGG3_0952650 [Trichomonas vaginalis G3]EAX97004.1 hypothetical protein TVAG_440200 [Trichomonas vaginalis G3]KAI5487323.1 hypothetical protein TVAGG3_0952650 [Trichomonas vaginalis G3]|eukprot:XP_001309934.1 hypothetical protein [Trichomonas vaginalis G3]